MKSTAGAHRSHPWTVHRLAADFEVIDVWRFEVGSGALGFERFLDAFWAEMQIAEGWALSRPRVAIGKLAGWDEAPNRLPIPGCSESSVAERLSVEEQAKNRVLAGTPSPLPVAAVRARPAAAGTRAGRRGGGRVAQRGACDTRQMRQSDSDTEGGRGGGRLMWGRRGEGGSGGGEGRGERRE